MISEFIIAGIGLYAYRKGQQFLNTTIPGLKNTLSRLKNPDSQDINNIWYLIMNNCDSLFNKAGETFETLEIKKLEYGWRLLVSIPNGKSFETLEKHKEILEDNFGATVFLNKTKRSKVIEVEVYDTLPDLIKYTPVEAKPYKLLLGYDYSNKPVFMDMSRYFNLILAGVVGTGKSRLLYIILTNLMATSTPKEVELYLYQPKKSDLKLLSKYEHVKMLATTLEETEAMLNKVIKIIESRQRKFDEVEALSIDEYMQITKKSMSRIYVAGEESSFLMEEKEDSDFEKSLKGSIIKKIKEIILTGRYVGVNLLMVTQRTTADNIDTTIKAMMCRCTGRQMSAINSNNVIEVSDAVGLDNGEFILMTNEYIRFRTPLIDKETIKQHLEKYEIKIVKHEVKKEDFRPIVIECQASKASFEDLDPRIQKEILDKRTNKNNKIIPLKLFENNEESLEQVATTVIHKNRNRKNTIKASEVNISD